MNSALVLQMLRFGVVGCINTVVGLSSIWALMFFAGFSPKLSNLFGYIVGLTVSFWLNKLWTFSNSRSTRLALPRYLVVVAVAYLTNLAVLHLSIQRLGIDPYWAQICGIIPYSLIFFVGCRTTVFYEDEPATVATNQTD